jgi:hypothetical protein
VRWRQCEHARRLTPSVSHARTVGACWKLCGFLRTPPPCGVWLEPLVQTHGLPQQSRKLASRLNTEVQRWLLAAHFGCHDVAKNLTGEAMIPTA